MAASAPEMSPELVFIVQPDFEESLEAQLLELCGILQQPRLQSLQSLRLEFRTSFVEICARFIEAAIKVHPGIRKLDLQMSANGDLSREGLARPAAALVMFEEVNLFFFSEEVEPRASEILRASLAASPQQLNSKMKKLLMPGDEKKHAHIIAEAGVQVKLQSYWKSDDKFDQDDFDAEVNSESDPCNDELGDSTSTDDLSIDCSDENSSNVKPATAE